jgi:hypothetical protein
MQWTSPTLPPSAISTRYSPTPPLPALLVCAKDKPGFAAGPASGPPDVEATGTALPPANGPHKVGPDTQLRRCHSRIWRPGRYASVFELGTTAKRRYDFPWTNETPLVGTQSRRRSQRQRPFYWPIRRRILTKRGPHATGRTVSNSIGGYSPSEGSPLVSGVPATPKRDRPTTLPLGAHSRRLVIPAHARITPDFGFVPREKRRRFLSIPASARRKPGVNRTGSPHERTYQCSGGGWNQSARGRLQQTETQPDEDRETCREGGSVSTAATSGALYPHPPCFSFNSAPHIDDGPAAPTGGPPRSGSRRQPAAAASAAHAASNSARTSAHRHWCRPMPRESNQPPHSGHCFRLIPSSL